mgnify:CR=1 FL=1
MTALAIADGLAPGAWNVHSRGAAQVSRIGPMPLHIGIVGCSAEGAALCYRTICAEGEKLLGPHAHPEVSMHTPSLAEYVHLSLIHI